jgi:FkbM family methyltransferase
VPSPLGIIPRYRIREGVNRWEVGGNEGAAYLFPHSIIGNAYEEIDGSVAGICLDIGASFGWYTVRWANRLKDTGRVVAVEPQLSHYKFLVRNIVLNQLSNVTALNCAAGDTDGSLVLYPQAFGVSRMDASAVYRSGGRPVEVPMRSIDSLCEELILNDVRFVKIDVDGFEPQVLRGMARLLRRDRPVIVFEALSAEALSACSAELSPLYVVRQLADIDFVANPA